MNAQQKTQAIQLVKTRASQLGIDLFHDPHHRAFATVPVHSHRETWEITSKRFRLWVLSALYDLIGCAPPKAWVQDCIEEFQVHALCRGPMLEVSLRVANVGDKIFVDLGDEDWQALEVSAERWRLVDEPPTKFRRSVGMAPLPLPDARTKVLHWPANSALGEIARFLNIRQEDEVLLLAWLSFAFCKGPFPVLVLEGVQGSGKSSTTRLLRSLIDPSLAMMTTSPNSERDLAIAATNSYLIAIDNLSSISDSLSDQLCRVATGGAFRTRTLYTNNDETILTYCRPQIINGIEALVTRPDLLDRSLLVNLEPISKAKRRDESELLREFEVARPRLFGALLDTVSAGLRNLPETSLPHLPRMADFARWGCAVEEALGFEHGDFLNAYQRNLEDGSAAALEASPVVRVIRQLLTELPSGHFKGPASDLLEQITVTAEAHKDPRISSQALELKHPRWPKSPNKLSGEVRRIQPNLEKLGIAVEFGRTRTQRWIDLSSIQLACDATDEARAATVA